MFYMKNLITNIKKFISIFFITKIKNSCGLWVGLVSIYNYIYIYSAMSMNECGIY